MSGVWKDIWTSLKAVVGLPATAVALGLALLGSQWNPSFQVSFSLIWLAATTFVVVIFLATAVKLAMDARRDARGELPRVVGVYCPPAAEGSAEEPITLIIGGSRQFGINFLVTVYYEERLVPVKGPIFERTIGMGQVVNVQENGLIQVLMLREVSNHAELWQRIRERDTAVLAGVVVKPSIDFNSIGIEVRFDERG